MAVIGLQMAAAMEAERGHQASRQTTSPIAEIRYEKRGLDFVRFAESDNDSLLEGAIGGVLKKGSHAANQFRESLSQQDLYTLLTFCRRSALRALRGQSAKAVETGFCALALIDLERIDWRDATVAANWAGLSSRSGGRPPTFDAV